MAGIKEIIWRLASFFKEGRGQITRAICVSDALVVHARLKVLMQVGRRGILRVLNHVVGDRTKRIAVLGLDEISGDSSAEQNELGENRHGCVSI